MPNTQEKDQASHLLVEAEAALTVVQIMLHQKPLHKDSFESIVNQQIALLLPRIRSCLGDLINEQIIKANASHNNT